MIANTPHQLPALRRELREMRRELGLLKAAFSSLNDPPIYYSTQRAVELYPVSQQYLYMRAAQGLISPMTVGRNIGWPKADLDKIRFRKKTWQNKIAGTENTAS